MKRGLESSSSLKNLLYWGMYVEKSQVSQLNMKIKVAIIAALLGM